MSLPSRRGGLGRGPHNKRSPQPPIAWRDLDGPHPDPPQRREGGRGEPGRPPVPRQDDLPTRLELAPDLAVWEFAGQDVDVVAVGVLDNASGKRRTHPLAP